MPLIAILGRQPALGLAELESLLGSGAVKPVGGDGAELAISGDELEWSRLGGSVKVAQVLTRFKAVDWQQTMRRLVDYLPEYLRYAPEGKITLGLSAYGFSVPPKQVQTGALEVKKAIRAAGRGARIVPNTAASLNAAQVLYNRLIKPKGMELILIKATGEVILARTLWVQDIDAYRRRDHERPHRDARVGMLPPKLAQIIINLASNRTLENGQRPSKAATKKLFQDGKFHRARLLDPFCGTGVLLQEALLMNYPVTGTDINPKMVEFSQKNLRWLVDKTNLESEFKIYLADATKHAWPESFDIIASETYLGRPLTSLPEPARLQKIVQDVNVINKKFLQNVSRQTSRGFRLCLAVPAWKQKTGFQHLPLLDTLPALGYNRISFVHAKDAELVYYRPGQTVARELAVLERI